MQADASQDRAGSIPIALHRQQSANEEDECASLANQWPRSWVGYADELSGSTHSPHISSTFLHRMTHIMRASAELTAHDDARTDHQSGCEKRQSQPQAGEQAAC